MTRATIAAAAALGIPAGAFALGRYTAPTQLPTPAIGTAIAHYPLCGTPRWTPGHATPGPCVAKP